MKGITVIGLLLILCLNITGCGSLFVESDAKYSISVYSESELEEGYFVKNEVRFFETYTQQQRPQLAFGNRVVWFTKDEKTMVPTLALGDSLVFKSEKEIPELFVLEQFENMGNSIGMIGIRSLEEEPKFLFSQSLNLKAESDAGKKFTSFISQSSTELEIVKINDTQVEAYMINKIGAFSDLEADKTYNIQFYRGTRYYNADLVADTEMYCSLQNFILQGYEFTEDGYIVLTLPADLTPGLYDINGEGIFYYSGLPAADQME